MLRVKLLSTGVVISLTAEPPLKTFLTWILGKEFRRKTFRERTRPVCECGLLGGEEPFKCPSAGCLKSFRETVGFYCGMGF